MGLHIVLKTYLARPPGHLVRHVARSIECHVKGVITDPIGDLEVDTFCFGFGSFIVHKLQYLDMLQLLSTNDSLVMSKVDFLENI